MFNIQGATPRAGAHGFGGPSQHSGGNDPFTAMMGQLLQMMMTLMMSQMNSMMGGSPNGMGAMFPGQSPGFGGTPTGVAGPGGGGCSPGGAMNNFLGGTGNQGGFPGPGTNGTTPFGGAATGPFSGTNDGGDWASKLPPQMRSLAPHFQAAGQRFNIDPKFLAAISMLETGKGTSNAFRNKNNAMGVSNSHGPIAFANPAESIYKMAATLARRNGPYGRANTIGQIGRIYAPPGAGNDPHGTNGYWPRGVSRYYAALGGNPNAAVKA